MPDDSPETIEIRPLTKETAEGVPYQRRPEVEAQLPEAVRLSVGELSERLTLPNKETPGYLYDETLVYLLREAHRTEDLTMQNLIYDHLAVRVAIVLRKHASQVNTNNSEDLAQAIHFKIIERIFDLKSDRSDYAQVNFGDFVTKLAGEVKRKHWREEKRERRNREIDAPNEEGHDFDPRSNALSPEEQTVLRNSLEKLPEKTATAFILHYIDGIQIESKDPDEPTVAGYFGVSGRTVRYWFKKAVEMLAEGNGAEE